MNRPVLDDEGKRRCNECNVIFSYYLPICRSCGLPFCRKHRSRDASQCQNCGPAPPESGERKRR